MPDLDQLLVDDARDDSCAAVPALDRALDTAQTSTRRRNVLAGGIAAGAALALCGGLFYAASGSSPAQTNQKPVHLAGYVQVLGPDPTHPHHLMVVGPQSERSERCTRVRDSKVTLLRRDGRITAIVVTNRGSYASDSASFPAPHDGTFPPGPYFVFSCPRD